MSFEHVNVSEMIRESRRRDPAAVDQLLGAYRNYLRVLAQVWLSPKLPAKVDPSDLVQETLLKAHERFDQFHGHTERELTAWLRRILSRCVVDVVRQYQAEGRDTNRERSLERSLDDSADSLDRMVAHSGSSPSQTAERREMGVVLADKLAQMPDSYRQVIAMRGLKEMEWSEIADQMHRTVPAVRQLWVRALSDLRNRLEEVL